MEEENKEIKVVVNEIQEYEDNNLKEETNKKFRFVLYFIISFFGLVIISLLLNISDKIRNFNNVAGYISLGIFFILFMIFYVRPIWIILQMNSFVSKKQVKDLKIAIIQNNKVRKNIAKKIINFNDNVKNSNWYDDNIVNELKIAVKENNNVNINKLLINLMNDSIKKVSDKIIVNSAVKSGVYAAVSQSPYFDALLVASVNFKMIKDIIFLYGFRPSEAKLIGIFIRVMFSSLAAYTLDMTQISAYITGKMASRSIPIIANMTGFVADAVIQAFTNGTITTWVGYKTIAYLTKEYKLHSLFVDIDVLDDSDEFATTHKEIMSKITENIPFIRDQFEKMKGSDKSEKNVEFENQNNINKKITLPVPINSYIGKSFIEVQKNFLKLGFLIENINLIGIPKHTKNFFSRDGIVEEVLLDGNSKVIAGTEVYSNAKIDIKYSTYI